MGKPGSGGVTKGSGSLSALLSAYDEVLGGTAAHAALDDDGSLDPLSRAGVLPHGQGQSKEHHREKKRRKDRPQPQAAAAPPTRTDAAVPFDASPPPASKGHDRPPEERDEKKRRKEPAAKQANAAQEPAQPHKRAKQAAPSSSPSQGVEPVAGSQQSWPYPVEYGDHFETSSQALADVDPVLKWLAARLGRKAHSLTLYDPYYCTGHVAQQWRELGYKHIVHEKRDFYRDVRNNTVPDYDVLVTNPPYSADHKQRIISYCRASGKPWLLLMPNYVANKSYWSDAPAPHTQPSRSPHSKAGPHGKQPPGKQKQNTPVQQQQQQQEQQQAGQTSDQLPFFIVPKVKYEYAHPEGTGHASSPFFSIWFVCLGHLTAAARQELQRDAARLWRGAASLLPSAEALRDQGAAPAWKRPNPRQRKKLKQQKKTHT